MLWIGVDGGGTKTAVAAYDGETKIASSLSGPMNYNFIGVDAAAENLIAGIRGLNIPMDQIAGIGIGDPSINDGMPMDPEDPAVRFAEKIKAILGVPVFIRSDAYITLFGLTEGKEPAVLMLSGTGAMGIAENEVGETRTAGGWGRLTGDEGSGCFISLEGIKAALHAYDGIAPKTALTDALLAYFNVKTAPALVPVFYGEEEPNYTGFAKIVAECAEAGDEVAQAILLDAAKYLAGYTSSLIDWSGSRKIGVYGSVICGNKTVRSTYEKILAEKYGDLEITEPPVAAEYAAAMYAKKCISDK